MAKVKNEMMRGDKKKSTAMATTDGGEEQQKRAAAIAMFQKQGFEKIAANEAAATVTEEAVLVDKEVLEGVPFHVLYWVMHPAETSDHNAEWMSVTCGLPDGLIVVFNDGSQYGVCAQLRDNTEAGIEGPLKNCTLKRNEYKNKVTGGDTVTHRLVQFISKEEMKAQVAASVASIRTPANGQRARA